MELWQLYDEQGRPLTGKGASPEVAWAGLLHGSSHVWIWHLGPNGAEVLLQKRATIKRTWPNMYDISAAGHIDLGEEPLAAALRETREEIGIDVEASDLKLLGVVRKWLETGNGRFENEFCWVYLLQIPADTNFKLEVDEVASLVWKPLEQFRTECGGKDYVPHEKTYYSLVADSVAVACNVTSTSS